jgi:hypothetical protein
MTALSSQLSARELFNRRRPIKIIYPDSRLKKLAAES